MASFCARSTPCDTPCPPHPGSQNASARAPFSATCHSPKRPLQNPCHRNNMPQSPLGGEGGSFYRLPATGHWLLPAFEGLSQLTSFQLLATKGPQEENTNQPEIKHLAKP